MRQRVQYLSALVSFHSAPISEGKATDKSGSNHWQIMARDRQTSTDRPSVKLEQFEEDHGLYEERVFAMLIC